MSKYVFVVRVRVKNTESPDNFSFGKGVAQLLSGIEQYSSLNKSARNMGMAYSKAWTKIKETEEHLGFTLIERMGAKGSKLTEKGKEFLRLYFKAEEAAIAAIAEVYKDINL